MSWILVASLVSLRNEFNKLSPSRDHASDGSIGDAAHAAEPSDHNPDESGQGEGSDADNIDEVHALDVDSDLKLGTNRGMTWATRVIADRHRRGIDKRLHYIIWNRQVASIETGWAWVYYDGSNPHTEHAHFSARYGSGSGSGNPENITAPWGLLDEEDDFMGLFKDLDQFKDYMVSLVQVQVPDAIKKGLVAGGVLRAPMLDLVTDGVREEKWDAVHALRNDSVYQSADKARQGEMRNALDLEAILVTSLLSATTGEAGKARDGLKAVVKEAITELTAEGKL